MVSSKHLYSTVRGPLSFFHNVSSALILTRSNAMIAMKASCTLQTFSLLQHFPHTALWRSTTLFYVIQVKAFGQWKIPRVSYSRSLVVLNAEETKRSYCYAFCVFNNSSVCNAILHIGRRPGRMSRDQTFIHVVRRQMEQLLDAVIAGPEGAF